MNRADPSDRFLWIEAKNWNHGVPGAELSVEIGVDRSGKALYCVIPVGVRAACEQLELAEHAKSRR